MDISYHFQNIESSDALKEHAHKAIDKMVAQLNNPISCTVRFKVEKLNHIVEMTMLADGGQFVADEKADDMYKSIDLVEKKMEKQIKKHKEKQQSHGR